MTPFCFSLQKKIQAAGVILRDRGHMDRLRLLKLLYIADRESLQERGVPIIGGLTVAMDHGPLHSEIYDFIKGARSGEAEWSQHIESKGNSVTLKCDPGRFDLSPYEIELLNEVATRYENDDTWSLSEMTHQFEEWRSAYRQGTSSPITTKMLLTSLGFSPAEIDDITNGANAHAQLLQQLGK